MVLDGKSQWMLSHGPVTLKYKCQMNQVASEIVCF